MVFAPPKTGEIESEICQQSPIKWPDESYPVDRRLEKKSWPDATNYEQQNPGTGG